MWSGARTIAAGLVLALAGLVAVAPHSGGAVTVTDPAQVWAPGSWVVKGPVASDGRIFVALNTDGAAPQQLWAVDAPGHAVKLTSLTGQLYIAAVRPFRDGVVFQVATDAGARSLWFSDGTPAGTRKILSGFDGLWTFDIADDRIWYEHLNTGELWVTDGQGAVDTGTPVTDLFTYTPPPPETCLAPEPPGTWSASPSVVGELDGSIIVSAVESRWAGCKPTVTGAGSQLWAVDKASLQVTRLTSVACQSNVGSPRTCDARNQGSAGFSGGVGADGAVYASHTAWPAGGTESRTDVWRVTAAGASRVATGVPGELFFEGLALGGRVVWDGTTPSPEGWTLDNHGVWIVDASGARKISGPGTSQTLVGVLDGEAYFLQDPDQGSDALMASDGSTRRTVADLNGPTVARFAAATRGVTAGGRLVFPALVGSRAGLWSTDGSGTSWLWPDDTAPFEVTTDGSLVTWKSGPSYDERIWATRPALARSASTTTLTGPSTVVRGRAANLRATVTGPGGVPVQGQVTFRDGTTTLGTATVVDGRATLALPPDLAVRSHTFRAAYGGGPGLLPSSSNALTIPVKAASTTRFTLSRTRWPASQTAKMTVTVGATPTVARRGSIQVLRGSKQVTLRSLPSGGGGRMTFSLPKLPRGTWKLRVRYLGSAKVAPSVSPTKSVTVTR